MFRLLWEHGSNPWLVEVIPRSKTREEPPTLRGSFFLFEVLMIQHTDNRPLVGSYFNNKLDNKPKICRWPWHEFRWGVELCKLHRA